VPGHAAHRRADIEDVHGARSELMSGDANLSSFKRSEKAGAGQERGEIEVVVDQVAERELEGAGQHLLCEIDRNELQAVVGRLESRHRRAPEKRCGIITTACERMRVGRGFSTAST
jgi:hypothetical protein